MVLRWIRRWQRGGESLSRGGTHPSNQRVGMGAQGVSIRGKRYLVCSGVFGHVK